VTDKLKKGLLAVPQQTCWETYSHSRCKAHYSFACEKNF